MTEPPERPDPATARATLRRAARAMVGIWLALVASPVLLAAGIFAIPAGLGAIDDTPDRMLALGVVLLVAVVLNVAVMMPGRLPRPDGLALEGDALDQVSTWLRDRLGDRHRAVTLEVVPDVWISESGPLRIGMPLLVCLTEDELAELVRVAHASHDPLGRLEHLALRLALGGVGRAHRPQSRVRRALDARARLLFASLDEWTRAVQQTRAAASAATADALAVRDILDEAWGMVVRAYLAPAARVGAWHDDPWTALRTMLAAWEEMGADVWTGHRRGHAVSTVVDALPSLRAHEAELARRMLAPEEATDDEPTSWEDWPDLQVRLLRQQVAAALAALGEVTGRPQPATFDALASALDGGWGEALLGRLGVQRRSDEPGDPGPDAVIAQLVEEFATLTVLDSGSAAFRWSWRDGCELVDPDGRPLELADRVREALAAPRTAGVAQVRAHVRWLGGDPTTPLWLAEGATPPPEQVLTAFTGWRRLRPEHVVLTTRAFHFFRGSMRTTDWDFVLHHAAYDAQGREPGSRRLPRRCTPPAFLEDVVRVEVLPNIGGFGAWWLRVETSDGRTRGVGINEVSRPELVPLLEAVVGDRLSLTWWELPRLARWARHLWGLLLFGFCGAISVIATLILVVQPAEAVHPELLVMAVGGAALAALAPLPDVVLRRRTRGSARRLPALTSTRQDPA